MRSVILPVPSSPPPSLLPQSGWTTALSATARPLLPSEWRLNIPRNQSSLAFWTHSQRPSAFHMLMPLFFISFVTMVGQRYHAKGRWIKPVNLFFSQLSFPLFPPPLSPHLFYHPLFEPAHIPSPSCRGLKKHRWSLLTCYSSLCQKLCQNNAPQQQAGGFYLFLLTRPVNFTDVSLGLNHQLSSFVLIKWLILNMNRIDNECRSEPNARQRCSRHGATGAWSRQVEGEHWRAGEGEMGEERGEMWEKVMARAGKREGAKESLC